MLVEAIVQEVCFVAVRREGMRSIAIQSEFNPVTLETRDPMRRCNHAMPTVPDFPLTLGAVIGRSARTMANINEESKKGRPRNRRRHKAGSNAGM
jgi:hypothetical protein